MARPLKFEERMVKKLFHMPPSIIDRVTEWKDERGIATESEAVRQLIALGLERFEEARRQQETGSALSRLNALDMTVLENMRAAAIVHADGAWTAIFLPAVEDSSGVEHNAFLASLSMLERAGLFRPEGERFGWVERLTPIA